MPLTSAEINRIKALRRDVNFDNPLQEKSLANGLDLENEPMWQVIKLIEQQPENANKWIAIGMLRALLYLKANKEYVAELTSLYSNSPNDFHKFKEDDQDPYTYPFDKAAKVDILRAQPYDKLSSLTDPITKQPILDKTSFHIQQFISHKPNKAQQLTEIKGKMDRVLIDSNYGIDPIMQLVLNHPNKKDIVEDMVALIAKGAKTTCAAERLNPVLLYLQNGFISGTFKAGMKVSDLELTEINNLSVDPTASNSQQVESYLQLFLKHDFTKVKLSDDTIIRIVPENYFRVFTEINQVVKTVAESSLDDDDVLPEIYQNPKDVWDQYILHINDHLPKTKLHSTHQNYTYRFDDVNTANMYLSYIKSRLAGIPNSGQLNLDQLVLTTEVKGKPDIFFRLSVAQKSAFDNLVAKEQQKKSAMATTDGIPILIKNFIDTPGTTDDKHRLGGGDSSICYQYQDAAILVIDLAKITDVNKRTKKTQQIAKNIEALKRLGHFKESYYDKITNKYYIAQKKFSGKTLQDVMFDDKDDKHPLNISKKLEFATSLAKALSTIHDKHIIHGDLHSANILTPGDIIDFDCCVLMDPNDKGKIVLREKYQQGEHVAPEWIKQNKASYGADIYSLGKLFSDLDTGNFALHTADYPDNFTPADKNIIKQFIELMCNKTAELRPNIKEVVDFFDKLEKKYKQKTTDPIIMPKLSNSTDNPLTNAPTLKLVTPKSTSATQKTSTKSNGFLDELASRYIEPEIKNLINDKNEFSINGWTEYFKNPKNQTLVIEKLRTDKTNIDKSETSEVKLSYNQEPIGQNSCGIVYNSTNIPPTELMRISKKTLSFVSKDTNENIAMAAKQLNTISKANMANNKHLRISFPTSNQFKEDDLLRILYILNQQHCDPESKDKCTVEIIIKKDNNYSEQLIEIIKQHNQNAKLLQNKDLHPEIKSFGTQFKKFNQLLEEIESNTDAAIIITDSKTKRRLKK